MSARPEPIKAIGPRRARAQRAAQRWAEANDMQGAPVEVVEAAASAAAEVLSRDLEPEELHRTCVGAVRTWVHDREQAAAEEAIASARAERDAVEQEARARYSAACAAALRAGLPTPDPPRAGVTVFTLDPRGRR